MLDKTTNFISTLFSKYPDFVIACAVAFDQFFTLFGAGNIYIIKQYEQNGGVSYFAGFNDYTILALGMWGLLIVQIIGAYVIWWFAYKYDLRREYLILVGLSISQHVYGVSTWYNGIPFVADGWEAFVYTSLANELIPICIGYILIVALLRRELTLKSKEWL